MLGRVFALLGAIWCVVIANEHLEPLTHHPKWHVFLFALLGVGCAIALVAMERE
jgi:hypothetical protein